MPAPKGNKNATTGRIWAEAIRRAVRESGGRADKADFDGKLARIAKGLVNAAEAGDIQAIKEIGDRLDGKPHQTVSADVDTTVTVEVVRFGK